MITSENQDLVRWGLHLLDGSTAVIHDTGGTDENSSVNEAPGVGLELEADPSSCMAPPQRRSSTVANDAIIAQALQEEFERLAAVEAAEASHVTARDNKKLQVTIRMCDHTNEEMEWQQWSGAPSSSTHQTSPYQFDDEDRQVVLALSEDFPQVDKEVARRLITLDSIPHIPRMNGVIPTMNDASVDHQRLLDRLRLYGLTEQKIKGDGNCQFRALSDQLYRSPEHHKFVRKSVVNQLQAKPDVYSSYMPMNYSDYLTKIARNGEWGDHVTLQAAADCYGVKICVMTSFKDTCFIEIAPAELKTKRELYLSFWAEVHYNSIYPIGGSKVGQSNSPPPSFGDNGYVNVDNYSSQEPTRAGPPSRE